MIHGPAADRDTTGRVAEVRRLHRSVAVVAAVDLGVAVVEAAAGVVVEAVDDPVLSFGLIVNRGADRIVVAKAHARFDEDAVDLVAHDRHRRHVGDRHIVESAHRRAAESAARRLRQVVVLRGLIVDLDDPAIRVRAETRPARLRSHIRLHRESALPADWTTAMSNVLPSDWRSTW
jgi:hypothetical protein